MIELQRQGSLLGNSLVVRNGLSFDFEDLGLLTGPHDLSHTEAARLTAELLDVNYAKVTFYDPDAGRPVIRAMFGFSDDDLDEIGAHLDLPLCRRILGANSLLAIDDMSEIGAGRRTPFVEALAIRSYLGVPLHDPANNPVGTLCVMDRKARIWSQRQRAQMAEMARLLDQTILLRAALATVRLLTKSKPQR